MAMTFRATVRDPARRTPCDPRTLTRAARDHAGKQPEFALEAGMLALHWLVQGCEITGAAYSNALKAAEKKDAVARTKERIRKLVAGEAPGGFVDRILGRELGLYAPE